MGIIPIDDEVLILFNKALKRYSKGEICKQLGYVRNSAIITCMMSGKTKNMQEWQRERLKELVNGDL